MNTVRSCSYITPRRIQLTLRGALRGALLSWLMFERRVKSIDNTGSNFHLHQWLVEVLDTLEILDAGFTVF